MFIEFPTDQFEDSDEEQLDLLGRAYVPAVLEGRKTRPVLVLTDKRLYQFGSVGHRGFRGKFLWRAGRKSAEIADIVEATYQEMPHRFRALLSVLLLLAGPAFLVAGGVQRHMLLIGLGSLALALGTLLGALYYMGRRIVFVVQLRDGFIATRLDWYRRGDVKAFQRGIWRKIDALKPIEAPPSLQWEHDWQSDIDR